MKLSKDTRAGVGFVYMVTIRTMLQRLRGSFGKRRVYADYASATPVDSQVLAAMRPYFSERFHNTGALYREGVAANHALDEARRRTADALGAHFKQIVFTRGGTESNNLAILGTLAGFRLRNPGVIPHVIASSIEHAAVRELLRTLESRQQIRMTWLSAPNGVVVPVEVKQALSSDTALVTVMLANNEIGTIQPIKDIAKAVRHVRSLNHDSVYPLIHSDAVQALQYMPLDVHHLGVDLLTVTAAKIYGPKSGGLLYVEVPELLEPHMIGGGQEMGLRPGTPDMPIVIGTTVAVEQAVAGHEREAARVAGLQTYLLAKIAAELPIARINGSLESRLPNNVHLSLPHIASELLILELDARGILASSRSACSHDEDHESYVIQALQYPNDPTTPYGHVRLSLGRASTERDCDRIVAALVAIVTKYQLAGRIVVTAAEEAGQTLPISDDQVGS